MGRNNRRKRIGVNESDQVYDLQPAADDIIFGLDDSFNRRYDYRSDSTWQLPSPTNFFSANSLPWEDNELMSMKSRLNDVKGRLSNVDIVTWQNHTQVCSCSLTSSPADVIKFRLWHWLRYRQDGTVVLELQYRQYS